MGNSTFTVPIGPNVAVTVGVDVRPALEVAAFEVVGHAVAITVAFVEAADAPLVDTGFHGGPVFFQVDGVVGAAQELGILARHVTASGAIDVVLLEGAVGRFRPVGIALQVAGATKLQVARRIDRSGSHILAERSGLGAIGHVGLDLPSVIERSGSFEDVHPFAAIHADPTAVGITRVGAAGCHVLTIEVVEDNPDALAGIDAHRGAEGDFNIVLGTRAGVVLLGDKRTGSGGAALVDHHLTRMGTVVEHLDLGHGEVAVIGHHFSREADAPVERTAGGEADGVLVHTVFVGDPTGFSRSGIVDEADVVDVEAVVIAVDTAVLGVSPLEGVRTRGDGELFLRPVARTGEGSLLGSVNVEVTVVVAALAGDLAIEAHQTVAGDFHADLDGRRAGGDAGIAALEAILALAVSATIRDGPRIGGIVLPIEGAEITGLEVFDELAHDVLAPIDLHQVLVHFLSDDFANRQPVLVE